MINAETLAGVVEEISAEIIDDHGGDPVKQIEAEDIVYNELGAFGENLLRSMGVIDENTPTHVIESEVASWMIGFQVGFRAAKNAKLEV